MKVLERVLEEDQMYVLNYGIVFCWLEYPYKMNYFRDYSVYLNKIHSEPSLKILITCSLASGLAREPLMLFSSCDKYKRDTKQGRRSYTMLL